MLMVTLGMGAATATTVSHEPPPGGETTGKMTAGREVRADSGATGDGDATWLRELRPVMKVLAETLGVTEDSMKQDAVEGGLVLHRFLCALPVPLSKADGQALHSCDTLLTLLNTPALNAHRQDGPASQSGALNVLSAYSSKDISKDGEVERARGRLLDFFKSRDIDDRMLKRLQGSAKRTNVHFLVATVADYVDSNAGWYADQQLDAIQGAMGTANFVLDGLLCQTGRCRPTPRACWLHEHTSGRGSHRLSKVRC